METRKTWFSTIGKENVPKGGGSYYCYEEHFDVSSCFVNRKTRIS